MRFELRVGLYDLCADGALDGGLDFGLCAWREPETGSMLVDRTMGFGYVLTLS